MPSFLAISISAFVCSLLSFSIIHLPILFADGKQEKLTNKVPRIYGKYAWSDAVIHSDSVDLSGKVAIVTGSSSGIGKALATELYKRGCTVLILSRSLTRSQKAAEHIKEQVRMMDDNSIGKLDRQKGTLYPLAFDVSDLEDVNQFANLFLERFDRLHFLSTNAGMAPLIFGHRGPWKSKQNYEILYASNYLGHFLLVQKLLPLLSSSRGKIVATSSIMHWLHDSGGHGSGGGGVSALADGLEHVLSPRANHGRSDEGENGSFVSSAIKSTATRLRQYGNTKLLQILMCFELQRRHPDVECVPVAPGFVSTSLLSQSTRNGVDSFGSWNFASVDAVKGAQTSLEVLIGGNHTTNNNSSTSSDGTSMKGVFVQPYYSPRYPRLPTRNSHNHIAVNRKNILSNILPVKVSTKLGNWSKAMGNAIWQTLYTTTPLWEVLGQKATWGFYKWHAHPDAYNVDLAKRIWDQSREACGLDT